MRVFFDPSAFAKRYLEEDGSEQVIAWCNQASELALSVVAVPELVSAFCRLQRESKITAKQYTQLKSQLLADIADALICDTTPAAIGHAVRALESHALRGMDAVHIGAAVDCSAQVFITSDRQQAKAAQRMGLQVTLV